MSLFSSKERWEIAHGMGDDTRARVKRIQVLAQIDDGRLSVQNGADVLDGIASGLSSIATDAIFRNQAVTSVA